MGAVVNGGMRRAHTTSGAMHIRASPELSSCTSTSTGSMHRGRRSDVMPEMLPPPASGCGSGVNGQVCRLAAEMGCTPTTLRAVPSSALSCLPSLSEGRWGSAGSKG